MTEERYHTLGEVAELLQVSERTVHRWITSGTLPAFKPGGDWRIGDSDLETFLESRRASTTKKAPAPRSSGPADEARHAEEERRFIVHTRNLVQRGTELAEALAHSVYEELPGAISMFADDVTVSGSLWEDLERYNQISEEAQAEMRRLEDTRTEVWDRIRESKVLTPEQREEAQIFIDSQKRSIRGEPVLRPSHGAKEDAS